VVFIGMDPLTTGYNNQLLKLICKGMLTHTMK